MTEPAGAPALLVRISVPADGGYRAVVGELARKIAEYVGISEADAKSTSGLLERLASRVAPPSHHTGDITFEFRQTDDDLLIEARCAGRSSEVRQPLPS